MSFRSFLFSFVVSMCQELRTALIFSSLFKYSLGDLRCIFFQKSKWFLFSFKIMTNKFERLLSAGSLIIKLKNAVQIEYDSSGRHPKALATCTRKWANSLENNAMWSNTSNVQWIHINAVTQSIYNFVNRRKPLWDVLFKCSLLIAYFCSSFCFLLRSTLFNRCQWNVAQFNQIIRCVFFCKFICSFCSFFVAVVVVVVVFWCLLCESIHFTFHWVVIAVAADSVNTIQYVYARIHTVQIAEHINWPFLQ